MSRKIALGLGIMDVPGGRKEHKKATPLLGGVGVMLACAMALGLVILYEYSINGGVALALGDIHYIFLGSLAIFLTGLIDDLFKEKIAFYYKLLGQIVGSATAMAFLFHLQLGRLIREDVPFADYVYLIILMGWMLTVINSFNFSDNINGLSTGLAVIALLTSMVYLGAQVNTRFIVLGFIMVGSILGFMPYNFPKARIFLGDAGSMFMGYWIGVILWPLTRGFFDGINPLFGLDNLIPPLLVMGVPLYDAAFVVFMRWREGRPVYLGDNQHLSHRLVRCGFSVTETVLILWGLALILGGIGAMSMSATYYFRYVAFLVGISFMLIITILVIKKEKQSAASLMEEG
jgi:UDP-GlcNAc:undecaprenyl-phosphate GlcNAc-1-phosphate transferase